jgi:NAD(P)-dependent dehydrogenase (short-subunit alcohol dehydrogenase family)
VRRGVNRIREESRVPGRVDGKIAIVTGAGAGIGRAISVGLGAEGAAVVGTDIDQAGAMKTAELIRSDGGIATAMAQDVTDETRWAEVVADVVSEYGTLDILVNNAGLYSIASLRETTLEEWDRVMAVNVTGVFLGMKHASAPMVKQRSGSIVNISSIAGLMGAPGHTLYGASKGAVRLMTKDVALELAARQVRVNSVHPSYVNTAMARYGAEAAGSSLDELGASYPLGRIGEPRDVAQAVVFLASEESDFMTGSELVVDGGTHAGIARAGNEVIQRRVGT